MIRVAIDTLVAVVNVKAQLFLLKWKKRIEDRQDKTGVGSSVQFVRKWSYPTPSILIQWLLYILGTPSGGRKKKEYIHEQSEKQNVKASNRPIFTVTCGAPDTSVWYSGLYVG